MSKINKLKWETEKKTHQTLWEEHTSVPKKFMIDIEHSVKHRRYFFRLTTIGLSNDDFVCIGRFKKLSSAKKVAQLIHNG
jgi:hypothetical protein